MQLKLPQNYKGLLFSFNYPYKLKYSKWRVDPMGQVSLESLSFVDSKRSENKTTWYLLSSLFHISYCCTNKKIDVKSLYKL